MKSPKKTKGQNRSKLKSQKSIHTTDKKKKKAFSKQVSLCPIEQNRSHKLSSEKDSVLYKVQDFKEDSKESQSIKNNIVSIGVDKHVNTDELSSSLVQKDTNIQVDISPKLPEISYSPVHTQQQEQPPTTEKPEAKSLVGFINRELNIQENLKYFYRQRIQKKNRVQQAHARSSSVVKEFTERRNPYNGGYFSLKNLE